MNVRAAVTNVHDSIAWHTEPPAQRIHRRHFSIAGWHLDDIFDLARLLAELEVTADDVIRRHDTVERRVHHEPGRGRHDVEIKTESVDAVFQELSEQRNVAL